MIKAMPLSVEGHCFMMKVMYLRTFSHYGISKGFVPLVVLGAKPHFESIGDTALSAVTVSDAASAAAFP